MHKLPAYKKNIIIEKFIDKDVKVLGLKRAVPLDDLWIVRYLVGQNCVRPYGTLNYNRISLRICQEILNKGIDINQSICGQTLTHGAIKSSNLELLKFLVEHGADLELRCTSEYNIITAAEKGNICVMQYLLDQGINIDQVSVYDNKPAIYYAVVKGNHKMVKLLLERKANTTLGKYDSLLWTAAQITKNRLKIMNLLLQYGATLTGTIIRILKKYY